MNEYSPGIERLCSRSQYARRLIAADATLRADLAAGMGRPFLRGEMEDFLRASQVPGSLGVSLRRLRQRVWLRVAARDLSGAANLNEVMASMTDLADVSILAAQIAAYIELAERYGEPIGAESRRKQELIVVAMGKLGGGELNVSSDVDLIFVFPEEGGTNGSRSIENQEFFNLLGKRIIALLAELTEDGFVFRVDMRLRPYGESGALTISFAALESYFVTQGRPWERYAWIKARAITGAHYAELDSLVKPFVFRRYLDYAAIDQIRDLHRQIRAEVTRRDRIDDVKLGRGGIREIEFLAQVFQLIRGGRERRLQGRSTLGTLAVLGELKLLSKESCETLAQSYVFLRELEHRLQYLDDAQTHQLPTAADDQIRIAAAFEKATFDDVLTAFSRHREFVAGQFDAMFAREKLDGSEALVQLWQGALAEIQAISILRTLGYRDGENILQRLQAIQISGRYRQLPQTSQARFDSLVPLLLKTSVEFSNPDETLFRTLDLLETVSRRETYLALLRENDVALRKVQELAAASSWAIGYLSNHPILLDELLDPRELAAAPDWPQLRCRLGQELNQYRGDVERQWDVLRHFKQAQMFRLISQDVAGLLPLEKLSDHLSDLADSVLHAALAGAWEALKSKHRDVPQFAVIAYGKLGGKELGYGSDLDIIFLYDDEHPDAPENYARLAQRLNSWLTAYTPAGVLYDTDLRLRPDGASGLLVSSVKAFEEYQSHRAWVWEHQALTRARYSAGEIGVGGAFEAIRSAVLCQPRELSVLRQQVIEMRNKMRHEHRVSADSFDIKHSQGGLVDIEFVVQYLVLGFAHRHPELTDNIGNIALLKRSAEFDLIPTQLALHVADVYRELRRMQHRAWLDGSEAARVSSDIAIAHVEPVIKLWKILLPEPA